MAPLHAALIDAGLECVAAASAVARVWWLAVVCVAALSSRPLPLAVGHVLGWRFAGAGQAGGLDTLGGAEVQVAVVEVEPGGVQAVIDAAVEAGQRRSAVQTGENARRRRNRGVHRIWRAKEQYG